MSKAVVKIRNISKSFVISRPNFRDTVSNILFQRKTEQYWSLRDISFEVNKGEFIGLVGRNGAGKSTLLKILSRIIQPTAGEVDIYGKLGSLLEVGTGFHPDLTGRENVYLNGSIIGMKYAQIKKGFDEIIDFAGVEKFVDTQVKHYSTGMHLRLAFSVTIFFRPDILLLDEVMAVGDEAFQAKCLEQMKRFQEEGKTVLFVSHDLSTVQKMCNRAILFEKGRIVDSGDPTKVSKKYKNLLFQNTS